MRLAWAIIPLVLIGIVGISESFAQELGLEYGEYESPGNVWVELNHSPATPPPWKVILSIEQPNTPYPNEWQEFSGEINSVKQFYEQYDVLVLDVIHSGKNGQSCEAIWCSSGTYHLLISETDHSKFQQIDFGYVSFPYSGIKEIRNGPQEGHVAKWNAKNFLLSTEGDFELDMDLHYESDDPTASYYYYSPHKEPVFVKDGLQFEGSAVFLNFPNGGINDGVIGIIADSASSKDAHFSYAGAVDFGEYFPNLYNYGHIGLTWIRIFEDDDGEKHYQFMQSGVGQLIKLNEIHSLNGTFYVKSPYPETQHYRTSVVFDYIDWLDDNYFDSTVTDRSNSHNKDTKSEKISVKRFHYLVDVHYDITNGNDVLDIQYKNGFLIPINSRINGILTIDIPSILSSSNSCRPITEKTFYVSIDSSTRDVSYDLVSVEDPPSNILKIPFSAENNEIRIGFSDGFRKHWQSCPLLDGTEQMSLMSPKKQLQNEIYKTNVKCNDGLELLLKTGNDSPVCVTSESKDKLIKTGWGHVTKHMK